MISKIINVFRERPRPADDTPSLNLLVEDPAPEPSGRTLINVEPEGECAQAVELVIDLDNAPPVLPAPPAPPARHTIYLAHRTNGTLWGRCLCGATLRNEGELDTHRRENNLPVK